MSIEIETKQFLTTGNVACLLGMTVQKVRRLCEIGKLPAVDTSTTNRPRWMIRRVDLDAFLTPAPVRKAAPKAGRVTRRQRIDADVPKRF